MFLSFLTVLFILLFVLLLFFLAADIISIRILKRRNVKQPSTQTEHRIEIYRKQRRNIIIAMASVFLLVLLCSVIGVFVLK